MPSKIVLAPAMHCDQCQARIEMEIGKLPGVDGVQADPTTKTVQVMWRAPQEWLAIAVRLTELGYPSQPLNEIKRHVAIILYDPHSPFAALRTKGGT